MTTLIGDLRPSTVYDVLWYAWSPKVDAAPHTITTPGVFVRQRPDVPDWNNAALEFCTMNNETHIFRARQIHVFKQSTSHYKHLMAKAEQRMNTTCNPDGPTFKEEICMTGFHPSRISTHISF